MVFDKYDLNQNGTLDRYEFELILEELRKSDFMTFKVGAGIFKKFVTANWSELVRATAPCLSKWRDKRSSLSL